MIPNGTFAAIQLTSETWDTAGLHSSTNNTRLTAPIDGIYMLTANVFWAGNSTGERDLGIQINGNKFVGFVADAAADVSETPLSLSTVYLMNAGDFAEARVEQTSGGGPQPRGLQRRRRDEPRGVDDVAGAGLAQGLLDQPFHGPPDDLAAAAGRDRRR